MASDETAASDLDEPAELAATLGRAPSRREYHLPGLTVHALKPNHAVLRTDEGEIVRSFVGADAWGRACTMADAILTACVLSDWCEADDPPTAAASTAAASSSAPEQ